MAVNFPTTLDTTTQLPTESASTPLSTNHVEAHTNLALAVIALETKVGVGSSAVTTTHDYKLSGVAGSDKAVSKTGSETLTNKTLTSPIITSPDINLGSDATGDILYRDSGGHIARLPVSTDGKILKLASGLPSWATETVTNDASTTVKGIVEAATSAEVTAGTATGSTGAVLAVTPDALAASTPVFDGSALTNIIGGYVGAITTNSSSTNQNLDTTFTCGFTAGLIAIIFRLDGQSNGGGTIYSQGTAYFNGTTFVNTFFDFMDASSSSVAITGATKVFNTTSPHVATATGSPTIVVTLSVTAVTSTGFTVRAAYTGAAGGITGHASYFPIANR